MRKLNLSHLKDGLKDEILDLKNHYIFRKREI